MERLIAGEDMTGLLSPDRIAMSLKDKLARSLSGIMRNLAVPIVACAVLRMVVGRGTDRLTNLLCALCCAATLTHIWEDARGCIAALIDGVLGATEALMPVMASISALTGGAFWQAAAGPLSGLGCMLIQLVLRDWGMKLCSAAAAVALCGAVAGRYAMPRLFELLKSALRWMLGAAVLAFGAMLSAQGFMGAAKDGAAMKAARTAMESVIPIIGGGLSDSAGTLAASAGVARSAIGITGVALILRQCAAPLIQVGVDALALKLVSALTEPLAEGAVSDLIGRFGDILELLLAIGACCGVIAAMLPACFVTMTARLF